MSNDFSIASNSEKIEKPWGYEIIITPATAKTTGKIAFTEAGARWSFQYHNQKEETICLLSGKAKLLLEDQTGEIEEIEMEEKKGYFIKPTQKHRLVAETDCLTLEVSTSERNSTTFRIEDDYGRGTETEEIRELLKKGEGNG